MSGNDREMMAELNAATRLVEIYRRRLAWSGSSISTGYDIRTIEQTTRLLEELGEAEIARRSYGNTEEEWARKVEFNREEESRKKGIAERLASIADREHSP